MTKRPSVIGGLKLSDEQAEAKAKNAAPAEPEAAAQASEAQAPTAPAPTSAAAPKASGRRARPEVVHTSVYLPREVHRRLREIAFTRDVKVHDVIMEGIDAALQKHGHPSAASLKIKGDA
ncbi:hypothetical protein WYO_5482 [Methylobacterium sp. GXF4]|uniref:hypothetical protein n=1 Tax=Methylobacterium sp. GXF4 TaxID=1096546 RepID=UPI000269AA12|nr:hypothetical protein [Methylobacterium sp. GXF4]EIZ81894.1 hypothetical protein WYO_5482 [Methylobacterium sp. GXF4]